MRRLLTILVVLNLHTSGSYAQSRFQSAIGGVSDDRAWCVIQTPDGGYAVAGETRSFGAGNSDFYIVKLNAGGTLQWSRTIGGANSDDVALSVVQTPDSGYALAGYTGPIAAGNEDMYIVKLDASGSLQWSKTVGGAGDDLALSIVRTADGGYAVAGSTSSFGAGGNDLCIVKLDANGSVQWSKTIGGTNIDFAYSLIQTADGGYAMTGYINSFGAGGWDMCVAKLNADGSLRWYKTVGGTETDAGYSIIQTSDGGYAVAGYTSSFGAGYIDMYIVKLDTAGTLQWSRTVGGTDTDVGYSIIQNTDGGFTIAGYTYSFGAGNDDMYIVKLDANGTFLSGKTIGGIFYDDAWSIKQTAEGGYAAVGRTNSFGAGGYDMYIVMLDSNLNTCGNFTTPANSSGTGGTTSSPVPTVTSPVLTAITFSSTVSTGGTVTPICLVGTEPVSNEIPSSFQLYQNYPNPFNPSTKIRFEIPILGEVPRNTSGRDVFVTLKIYDLLGREAATLINKELSPGSYEVEWSASDYTNGIYFYRITVHSDKLKAVDHSETRKMVLIK